MESKHFNDSSHGLANALRAVLAAGGDGGPTIRMLTTKVGEKGFGLLLMVLSLPSALPVPAPGYSTPFGIVIGFVAFQMLIGRGEIWLPHGLAKIKIKPEIAEKMIGAAATFIEKIEHFIKPRQKWIGSRLGQMVLALIIFLMASLMILPIPLTNTFPAMVIFLFGVSIAEDDGLLAILSLCVGMFAVCLYAGIVFLLISQGPEAIDALKDSLKSILGLG